MVVIPARPGRSEGNKNGNILWSLLLPLAGFSRTVSGDSRSRNAVKPAAWWTFPDVPGRTNGARRGLENRASKLRNNHFFMTSSADTLVDTLRLFVDEVR